jgi:hypothetical protein
MLSQIFRSPLTRLFGLRQWHCDLLGHCFQALESAVIQDLDASTVHLELSNLRFKALAKPV